MKVEMKVPSTTWFPRSRMKFCSRRGPSCDDASESAAMVMEKTIPAVLMTEPATTWSTARAPSEPPEKIHPISSTTSAPSRRSSATAATAIAAAAAVMSAGTNQ